MFTALQNRVAKTSLAKILQIYAFIFYIVFAVASDYSSYISVKYLLNNLIVRLLLLVLATSFQALILVWPVKYFLKLNWRTSWLAALQMAALSFVLVVTPLMLYFQNGVATLNLAAYQNVTAAIGTMFFLKLFFMSAVLTGLGTLFYWGLATFIGTWVLQQYQAKLERKRSQMVVGSAYALVLLIYLGFAIVVTHWLNPDQLERWRINKSGQLIDLSGTQPVADSQAFKSIKQLITEGAPEAHIKDVIRHFMFAPHQGDLTPAQIQELLELAQAHKLLHVIEVLERFGGVLVYFKQLELTDAKRFL